VVNLDHISSPDHGAGIDPVTAFITERGGQRDLALLTERAHIGVEEQLDLSTHRCTARRTSRVIQFEIPDSVTLGTVVVRDHLDLAIDHVLLGRGVTTGLVRRLTL
jgi:hypothetical protein